MPNIRYTLNERTRQMANITYEMDMVLEYAKVFKENADYGNPESPMKFIRDLNKNGGKTCVNAYFTSDKQIQKLLDEGFDRMVTNPQTGQKVDRIKDGKEEFGIGKYLHLQRRITDVKEYVDKKTKKLKTFEAGGMPLIVDLREGRENRRFWDFEEDGELGNGTEAKVSFEIYNKTTVRLKNIGVTKLSVWEQQTPEAEEIPF